MESPAAASAVAHRIDTSSPMGIAGQPPSFAPEPALMGLGSRSSRSQHSQPPLPRWDRKLTAQLSRQSGGQGWAVTATAVRRRGFGTLSAWIALAKCAHLVIVRDHLMATAQTRRKVGASPLEQSHLVGESGGPELELALN